MRKRFIHILWALLGAGILFCIFIIRDYIELIKLRHQSTQLDVLIPAKQTKI